VVGSFVVAVLMSAGRNRKLGIIRGRLCDDPAADPAPNHAY
jgi:hypothetical protein